MNPISLVTSVNNGLSGIAMVVPKVNVGYQPFLQPPLKQPPALLFHYEGEQNVEVSSDITDHFIEDNTTIQDQIALRPEKIMVHGFIGELNNVLPGPVFEAIGQVSRLALVSDFAPELSVTAQNAFNQAAQGYQAANNVVNSAVSAWSSINGNQGTNTIGSTGLGTSFDPQTGRVSNNQTKQQIMFQQFYGYWRTRTLFKVQTPWAIFENMAIESLRAIQNEDTRMITDFMVTFKMLRFAKATDINPANFSDRAALEMSPVVDQGTTIPTLTEKDMAETIATIPVAGE